MSVLNDYETIIRRLVEELGYTCSEVKHVLETQYGIERGASTSSIYQFCAARDIHRYDYSRLGREGVNAIVAAVTRSGPVCGRKVMTGMLRAAGFRLGERSVRQAQILMKPVYTQMRREGTASQMNPHVYPTEYVGQQLYMDQNEKLNDFGVTEVLASDSFSGKILGFSVMPIKNNLTIYDEIYRDICLKHGLFDQLSVDYSKEFYLCLYQQDNLQAHRTNINRPPYIQSESRQNQEAERKWVEINARVNDPIKHALCSMTSDGLLDIDDLCTKFCVSSFARRCCTTGIDNLIPALNAHTISRQGIPDVLFANHLKAARITEDLLPPANVLAADYIRHGGSLTHPEVFGNDPLDGQLDLQQQREDIFSTHYPSFENIFYSAVNGHYKVFKDALLTYIDITQRMS